MVPSLKRSIFLRLASDAPVLLPSLQPRPGGGPELHGERWAGLYGSGAPSKGLPPPQGPQLGDTAFRASLPAPHLHFEVPWNRPDNYPPVYPANVPQ